MIRNDLRQETVEIMRLMGVTSPSETAWDDFFSVSSPCKANPEMMANMYMAHNVAIGLSERIRGFRLVTIEEMEARTANKN